MAWKLDSGGAYTYSGADSSSNSSSQPTSTESVKNNPADTKDAVGNATENKSKNTNNVFGRGSAKGNCKLRKGKRVSISGTGRYNEGIYTVIETTHTIDSSGYTVEFSVGVNKPKEEKEKEDYSSSGKDTNSNNTSSKSESSTNSSSGNTTSSTSSSSSSGHYVLGSNGKYSHVNN